MERSSPPGGGVTPEVITCPALGACLVHLPTNIPVRSCTRIRRNMFDSIAHLLVG